MGICRSHGVSHFVNCVQPHIQHSPLRSQLKASLPELSDLEVQTSEPILSETAASRKGSFQDLRRQRLQKKSKSSFSDESRCGSERHGPDHSSHSYTERAATVESFQHPPGSSRGPTGRSIHPLDPTLFLQEHYPTLHTLGDEDFEEGRDPRARLHRVSYHDDSSQGRPAGSENFFHGHTQHGQHSSSYSGFDDVPPNPQTGLYTREGYPHTSNSSMPYISGSGRRPSVAQPRPGESRERQAGGRHGPTFDEYRLDPPKYRLSLISSSSTGSSMDTSVIDEDRKLPAALAPHHRQADEATLRLGEDRRYHERHSDVRTEVVSSLSSTFPSELE